MVYCLYSTVLYSTVLNSTCTLQYFIFLSTHILTHTGTYKHIIHSIYQYNCQLRHPGTTTTTIITTKTITTTPMVYLYVRLPFRQYPIHASTFIVYLYRLYNVQCTVYIYLDIFIMMMGPTAAINNRQPATLACVFKNSRRKKLFEYKCT